MEAKPINSAAWEEADDTTSQQQDGMSGQTLGLQVNLHASFVLFKSAQLIIMDLHGQVVKKRGKEFELLKCAVGIRPIKDTFLRRGVSSPKTY